MKSIVPCPASFNLAQYVLYHGQADSTKLALRIIDGPDLSYGDLRSRVANAAALLQRSGISVGDHVMLRLDNSLAFPIAFLALVAIDAIPIVTSSQLTAPEVDRLVDLIRPTRVIADTKIVQPSTPLPTISGCDLLSAPDAAFDPVMDDPNRPAYIVFTSGTSGTPKAVVHAHRSVWARRMMWDDWYGLRSDDRLYHAGAFNWTFTLGTGLMDPWAKGATAIIAPGQSPAWDLLRDNCITLFAAAPGVLRHMLKIQAPGLPNLRHALTAGDRLSPVIRARWQDQTNTNVLQAFGMTECSTFLSDRPNTSVGLRAQTGRNIKIMQSGAIAVHRSDPGLMLGYFANREIQHVAEEWFETNDIGCEVDGKIEFQGRTDGLLNAGGYRISPAEVEDHLMAFAGIEDVAVTEITVKADTTILAAFIIGPTAINQTQLQKHAAAGLARYKQPRIYQQVTEFPRNTNGKLLRKSLPDLWRP
ncbi:MAG: class I adenylate-forming enzyme family protein [Planktomarina sp.]